jgi:tol-pal system protein YbgF
MIKILAGVALALSTTVLWAAVPVTNLSSANAALNAQAGTPQAASLTLSQRLSRLENQVQYLSTVNAKMNSLTQEIQGLRGQLQVQKHTVGELKSSVDMLKERVASVEATQRLSSETIPDSTAMQAVKSNGAAAGLYKKAYAHLNAGKYSAAITDFSRLVDKYPKSTNVPDANYWLGELYLYEGKPDRATSAFKTLLSEAPKSSRVPEVTLKLGTIFLANGDPAHAKEMFQKVVKQYPHTEAAKQAAKQLASMQ